MTPSLFPETEVDQPKHSLVAEQIPHADIENLVSRPVLPLGEQLIRAGVISPDELEAALREQSSKKLRLGETLLELGFISEDDLLPFIEHQLKSSAVKLRDGVVDPVVVRLLPRTTAEAFNVLALFKVRDTLTVAMTDPQDLQQIDEIERITRLKVRPVIALGSAITKMLPRCYEDDFTVDTVTADMDQDSLELQSDMVHVSLQDVESLADGSPIINLVNYVIVNAVRQGSSDIHIEPGQKHTTIRFRVDGMLREVLRPRREFHPAIISRVKVMAKMDIAERRMPQDGRMHVMVEGRPIDLRISTLPTVLGEKVVIRVLDRRQITFNLDELGVPSDLLQEVKQILGKPHGLVLVTGPTGSGKTTTLYSALELIKSVHRNIVTVEDPVEYQLELINQVQSDSGHNLTFANALRSILRQDPDVIMIGEIRDSETAEVAVQAALTGHLVLSTLHTNDSASAITRLLDMGLASYKIAASLVGVIAQRLVRTVCPHCQTQFYPSAEFLESIQYEGDARRQFTRGEGCNRCYDTGFLGRQGVFEVLSCNAEARRIISADPNLDVIRDWRKSQGYSSLMKQGILMAEAGKTSLDEVIRLTGSE